MVCRGACGPPQALHRVLHGCSSSLAKHGLQLRGHCREQGLDLSRLAAASGAAAPAALDVLPTLLATMHSMWELGDGAQTRHRLRQSDVRRYLKS